MGSSSFFVRALRSVEESMIIQCIE